MLGLMDLASGQDVIKNFNFIVVIGDIVDTLLQVLETSRDLLVYVELDLGKKAVFCHKELNVG
jgi:hypothetical protein